MKPIAGKIYKVKVKSRNQNPTKRLGQVKASIVGLPPYFSPSPS